MTYREREALDNWITGNGGQDQYDDPPLCDLCGEPLEEGEGNTHKACDDYENHKHEVGGEL